MEKLTKLLTILEILLLLLGASYFAFKGQLVAAAVIVIAFAVALCFTNLDRIESFKGSIFEGSIEAKMKKVEEVTQEAYATIDHMRKLAAGVTKPVLLLMGMEGRMFQHITARAKINLRNQLANSLTELGLKNEQIDNATEDFDRIFIHDHLQRIDRLVKNDENIDADTKEKLTTVSKIENIYDFTESTFTELKGMLEANKAFENSEVNEAVMDLDYYLKEHKLRRPETWQ